MLFPYIVARARGAYFSFVLESFCMDMLHNTLRSGHSVWFKYYYYIGIPSCYSVLNVQICFKFSSLIYVFTENSDEILDYKSSRNTHSFNTKTIIGVPGLYKPARTMGLARFTFTALYIY